MIACLRSKHGSPEYVLILPPPLHPSILLFFFSSAAKFGDSPTGTFVRARAWSPWKEWHGGTIDGDRWWGNYRGMCYIGNISSANTVPSSIFSDEVSRSCSWAKGKIRCSWATRTQEKKIFSCDPSHGVRFTLQVSFLEEAAFLSKVFFASLHWAVFFGLDWQKREQDCLNCSSPSPFATGILNNQHETDWEATILAAACCRPWVGKKAAGWVARNRVL